MDEETRSKLTTLYSLVTNIHQANVRILKNQKEIMTALIDAKLAANQISGKYADTMGILEAQANTDFTLKQITGE